MAFSWHFPPLSHPQRAQLSELESARARLCSCPLAAARRPKVTGPKRSSKAWPNSGIHSGSVRFFMGIFWDVWDSDHVFFFWVVSVGWKYVQNQLDLHRGLYVTFMGISMISLYRGISYIHATRNDPFMWFMCRDMYHHHGACGVAMLDKSSPQLLGSRHAHGWPSNQKKEHKKKHHTRAVKKHEEQTGNVSNIFHIIYVAHLLICLFSNSTIKNIPSMLQWQLLV